MSVRYRIFCVAADHDLQNAFEIRRRVFIEEQSVPAELELDELDCHNSTTHIIAVDYDGNPVGTARFRPYEGGAAKVERVAVLPSTRNTGLGRKIMEYIEQEAKQRGFKEVRLNAQTQAQGFYEKLHYIPHGDLFYEAGIPHVHMKKSLE